MLPHDRLGVAENIGRLLERAAHLQDLGRERMPEAMRARPRHP